MTGRNLYSAFLFRVFSILVITIFITSCIPGIALPSQTSPAQVTSAPTLTATLPPTSAEVDFEVTVPSQTPQDAKIALDILDEVTGLAFNTLRYSMEAKDAAHFSIRVPLLVGSIVKYRYVRESTPLAVEYTPQAKQVRYRLFQVTGSGTTNDSISAWNDVPFKDGVGRIHGQVTDAVTNLPVVNVLVVAGGIHTLTSSDGSFILEGLSAGTHNLVAYSLDGSYQPYSQGAVVAMNATTPAPIHLVPAAKVKVTFVVHPPQGNTAGIPMRMVGNTYALGNTFADLDGGFSVVASRAPLLTAMTDGTYTLSLELPAGLDLRYKYTLGDGFWNAEHLSDGQFRLRQLVIPNKDILVNDSIDTWQAGNFAPITFNAKVPDNTPADDIVSIQFNPYDWSLPIPMWPLGKNQWTYVLYSPLDLLGKVGHRYCRNDQCGVADDQTTSGLGALGPTFEVSQTAQTIQDEVKQWAWLQPSNEPSRVVAVNVVPRGSQFITGIEVLPNYSPTWQSYLGAAFQNLKALGTNWAVLTPSWHYTHVDPPVIGPVAGKDPLWLDVTQMSDLVKKQNMDVALYPQAQIDASINPWVSKLVRGDGWWNSWFDRYRTFILYNADLAEQTNASALIIGEPSLLPALPNGKYPDGSASNVPLDAEGRWRKLIKEIRDHYKGSVVWALPYPDGVMNPPKFITEVDQVYVLWSAQLTGKNNSSSQADMTARMGQLLDEGLLPLKNTLKKPIIVAIKYASVAGSAAGCVKSNDKCLQFNTLDQPVPNNPDVQLDLKGQQDIYNAILVAINQRKWVDGIVSRGYYPPTVLQDKSSSIHGKPAADSLWYWYPRMLIQAPK